MINKPPEYALRPRRPQYAAEWIVGLQWSVERGLGKGLFRGGITCMQVGYVDWIGLICSIFVVNMINMVNTAMQGLGLVALICLGLRGVWGLGFPLE